MQGQTKFLKMSDKTEIHLTIREVDSPVWLIVTHGMGEHSGRHQHLTNLFGRDFNILYYDLRGHGKSSGRRAYIDSFQEFYSDLDEIITMLKRDYGLKSYVLFGHSLGGLITAGYVQGLNGKDHYPESVFLSSPATGVPGPKGVLASFLPMTIFDNLQKLPSIAIEGIVDLKNLSHNKNVYKDYIEDSFNCLKVHTNLVLETVKEMRNVFNRPLRLKCPGFCVYGTEDKIVDIEGIKEYFQTIERAVLVQEYPGAYHEIHNESEKYRRDYFNFLKNSLLEVLYRN